MRVIALNVDEGWSRDVSEAMAHKVREIAEHEDYELTQGTLDFIDAHIGRVRQPTLPSGRMTAANFAGSTSAALKYRNSSPRCCKRAKLLFSVRGRTRKRTPR